MSSGSIRIIQLPEKSSVNTDDYMAVDSSTNGTKKVKFTDLLDNNLSAQNKAADAQATGEAINTLNTNINNANARIDNLIIDGEPSVETLWTGTLEFGTATTATLSESVSNYDFLDFYTDDNEAHRVRVSSGSIEIKAVNTSDNASVAFFDVGEALYSFSGTTVTLVRASEYRNNQGTISITANTNTYGNILKRVDGVKMSSVALSEEVSDIRVGDDGVTYDTAGNAVRKQFSDLKSEINTLSNKSLLAFSAADFTNGYISATGAEVSNTTNMRTGYINVSDWFAFDVNTLVDVAGLGIAEYSSENPNGFIKRTVVTNTKHNEIVFDEVTKFIRIWVNYNNADNPIDYFSTIGLSTYYLNRPAYKSDLETLSDIVFTKSEFTNNFISGTGEVIAQADNMMSAYKNVAGSTDVVINTDVSVKTIAVSQFSEKDSLSFIRRDYVQDTNKYKLSLNESARYIRIAINYDNSHDPISYYNTIDLSAYRNSHIASKAETGILENEIKEISKSIGGKYIHFSFDDCVFWHDLITNKDVYTSAFENSMLGALRRIHESLGAKFTLNCFCADGSVSISDVPNKFQSDFQDAKDWLKFAFHAEDANTHYDTDKVAEITSSYNTFVNAIYKMTGDYECIDRIPRLGFFSGTLNNVLAIRDAYCGITGLLTADDTRVSYYFDTSLNDYMLAHPRGFDALNQLMLVKSQPRVDGIDNMNTYCDRFITKEYSNFYKYLEIFMHEYSWTSAKEMTLMSMFDIFKHRGYAFEFWDNVFNV